MIKHLICTLFLFHLAISQTNNKCFENYKVIENKKNIDFYYKDKILKFEKPIELTNDNNNINLITPNG